MEANLKEDYFQFRNIVRMENDKTSDFSSLSDKNECSEDTMFIIW